MPWPPVTHTDDAPIGGVITYLWLAAIGVWLLVIAAGVIYAIVSWLT